MKKTTHLLLALTLLLSSTTNFAQVAINTDGSAANASAILDVKSNNRGMLIPRMTEGQRDAIVSPAAGLIIYNIDYAQLDFYDGTSWNKIDYELCNPLQPGEITGNTNPCENQTGLTYSILAVSRATNYIWEVPSDATLVSGQGSTSVVVDMGVQSGNVSVRAGNSCGNSAFRDLAITIRITAPLQPDDITGNLLVDDNATGQTYSITAVSGAYSYGWIVPSGASIMSGQGTTSISVNFGTASGNVRVYATNGCGNSDTTDIFVNVFSCGEVFTDTRENTSEYNTVLIGSQCWFSENLNIGTRIDGANDQTNNSTIEKYCYSDTESNCDTYGGLYQWAEVVQYLNGATNTASWDPVPTTDVQGICPMGWHIPTDDEWKTMEMQLGMSQSQADAIYWRGTDEGGKMKETGTTHWQSPNTGATNSSGFTALPEGFRNSDMTFYYLGDYGYWKSITEHSASLTWYRSLAYNEQKVGRNFGSKTFGQAVRCLKD